MTKKSIYCDLCGKEDAITWWFTVDRFMDPAGSMDDAQESFDLCSEHGAEPYLILAKNKKIGREHAAFVYQNLNSRRKKFL